MTTRRAGYIFVETVVAMGILSVTTLVIQNALRQAILTRSQAQDYTTARFLLERVAGERALLFQQPEGRGSGVFEPPYDRFSYEWDLKKVDLPRPPLPPYLDPIAREQFEEAYVGYLGKLLVRVKWSRAGTARESVGETLLRPALLWLPEDER